MADLLRRDGLKVVVTSRKPRRTPRLLDTVRSLVSWRNDLDVAVIMVFSGPAFRMAQVSAGILKAFGVPVVLWLHGGDIPEYIRRHPQRVRRLFQSGRTIVSPSPYLADASATLGFDVRVVPNIVDVDAYDRGERSSVGPRLLWMRTFHELYQPEMAIAVLVALRRSGIDAVLTMAGQDKGELHRVSSLADELGVGAHVRFPGFLDVEAKRREFAGHDIFLNTNRIDNMPVSVLEAAAAGLSIVTTDVGGIKDFLRHEESALLVGPRDVSAMSDCVKRLLGSPELAMKISSGGRSVARACSWRAVGKAWKEILQTTRGDLLSSGT